MRLTGPGRVFLLEARAVLARAEDAVAMARGVAEGDRGQIHIGYAPSLTPQILPAALRALHRRLPGIRVVLRDHSTEEMLAGLRDGSLDVALMLQPSRFRARGLHFKPLERYQLALAVSPDHPFARRGAVRLALLAKESIIAYDHRAYPEYLSDMRRLFRSAGVKLNLVEEHDSVSSLTTAIAAGRGVALLPESIVSMVGQRVCLVPLRPALPPILVGAVRRAGKALPAVVEFIAGAAEGSRGAAGHASGTVGSSGISEPEG